jgi:hypothetical protein
MDRGVFHFLPDTFKLGRLGEAPHKPTLRMRFEPGDVDDMRVELDYFAWPYVDRTRLEHAARELPAQLDGDPLKPGQIPAFKCMSPPREQLKLRLGLPGSSGLREGAEVELSSIIRERLHLSLDEFKEVWESLSSSLPVLFQGSIEVTLSDGVEQIPFVGRMDDLEGPTVDTTKRLLPSGEADVTITNTCESPVTLGEPHGFVLGPDGPVACTIAGIDPAAPITLQPGAPVDLHLVPVSAVQTLTDALVRFDRVDVAPDRDAIYEAILDTTVPLVALQRTIEVHGKHLFDPPDPDLVAVLVEFEHGQTVDLTAEKPEGTGVVQVVPVRDYVLGEISSADVANGSYRYRVTVVREQAPELSSDWSKPQTPDTLYPQMPAPPAPPAPPVPPVPTP